MYAVVRVYTGQGAKQFFDILEERKEDLEAAHQHVKGLMSYTRRSDYRLQRKGRCSGERAHRKRMAGKERIRRFHQSASIDGGRRYYSYLKSKEENSAPTRIGADLVSLGFLTNSKWQRFAESVEFDAKRINGWFGDAIDTGDREDLVKKPIQSGAIRRNESGQGALAIGGHMQRTLAKLV